MGCIGIGVIFGRCIVFALRFSIWHLGSTIMNRVSTQLLCTLSFWCFLSQLALHHHCPFRSIICGYRNHHHVSSSALYRPTATTTESFASLLEILRHTNLLPLPTAPPCPVNYLQSTYLDAFSSMFYLHNPNQCT